MNIIIKDIDTGKSWNVGFVSGRSVPREGEKVMVMDEEIQVKLTVFAVIWCYQNEDGTEAHVLVKCTKKPL